jgi:acyl carrier protein
MLPSGRRADSLDTIHAITELEEALGVNLRADTEPLLGLTEDDREFLAHVCQCS